MSTEFRAEGYVAAITEAIHSIVNTTSFFHKGQFNGSSGSHVGYKYQFDSRKGKVIPLESRRYCASLEVECLCSRMHESQAHEELGQSLDDQED
jgi:hypothetical protein